MKADINTINLIMTLIIAAFSALATAGSTYAALVTAGIIDKPEKKPPKVKSQKTKPPKAKPPKVELPEVEPLDVTLLEVDSPEIKLPKAKPPRRRLSKKKKLILSLWATLTVTAGLITIASTYKVYLDVVPEPEPSPVAVMIAQGETRNIPFGDYTWRVLEVQNDRALLLTEDIIEQHCYHEKAANVTWETCTLREYLNGEVYENFSAADRKQIALTRNENPDNTWGSTNGRPFNTPGGNPTDDYIFLLSVADVLQYFPDLILHKDERYYKADERLIAKFNDSAHWWWLRSPGMVSNYVTSVDFDGRLFVRGLHVYFDVGGVRPALWVKL